MKIDLSIAYLNRFRQLGCFLTIFGVLQFFLFTSVAAFFYPGGYDPLKALEEQMKEFENTKW